MAVAQKPTPSIPSSKPLPQSASQEFSSMKHEIKDPSWGMVPNNWDKIQIAYVQRGNEQQAKSLMKTIQLRKNGII